MDIVVAEPSLISIKGICILDGDGNRVLCKYYDNTFPSLKEQQKFEESLFKKTQRANSEIIMYEGVTAVYKSNVDLFFYVLGSQNENELMMMAVLNGIYDSLNQILKKNLEKRALVERMDALLLVLDEVVDGGIILETEPTIIMQRVAIKAEESTFSEQSVVQVLQSAKDNLKWSLLK